MPIPIKRILWILGFSAIVAVFGYLIYLVFFASFIRPSGNGNANVNGGGEGLPTPGVNTNANANRNVNASTGSQAQGIPFVPTISAIANGGLTSVSQLTSGYTTHVASAPTGVRYWDEKTGKFLERGSDGSARELSPTPFPSVQNAAWSRDGSQVIMKFPDGSHVLYNFSTGKQATLPRQFDEPKFSADGSQIAFEFNGRNPDDDSFIGIGNPDGTDVQPVELLGKEGANVEIAWSPKSDIVATFRDSLNSTDQEIFPIGKEGENLKSFRVEGRGFQSAWAPSGDKLLYSVYEPSGNYLPSLWVTDVGGNQTGANNVSLRLNTWVNKCAFGSGSVAYCGVPARIERGAGLYPELNDSIPDVIYRVDLGAGTKTLVAAPVNEGGEQVYTVNSINLSADGKTLYFTDKKTGRLNSIRLE